jgi:serine/threonine-protein kinase
MDNEATRIGAAGASGGGQLAVGSVLAHTYEIVRFIRAGGMGEVYEARHLVDGSRLAVKFIRPDLVGDERIRAMFVREGGILRRIRDDAVVGYEGLLQDEQGHGFLVMSYVDGPSLAERAEGRPLGTEEAMRLLTRLARGLAAAHAEGTFHRDLSPDNILLPGGDLDRAVIIDFGIAKLAEPQAGTLVGGDIAGKASYMSPEQLGVIRQPVDARSDIYSLALTIAAAVRGRSLHAGGSWAEVVEARRHIPDRDGI